MKKIELMVVSIKAFGEKADGRELVGKAMETGEWVRFTVPFGDPDGIVAKISARLSPGPSKKGDPKVVFHAAGKFPVYVFDGAELRTPTWEGDLLLTPMERRIKQAKRNREIVDARTPEEVEAFGSMPIVFDREIVNTRGIEVLDGEIPEDRKRDVDALLWKCKTDREARIAALRQARRHAMNPMEADAVTSLGL